MDGHHHHHHTSSPDSTPSTSPSPAPEDMRLPCTLTRYILEVRGAAGLKSQSLSVILSAVATASKVVANVLARADVRALDRNSGVQNPSDEEQKRIDVVAHRVFVAALQSCKKVSVMVSEEQKEPVIVTGLDHAHYAISFDPLDGSSNVACHAPVGTIFGIQRTPHARCATVDDALRPAREMVAAGYVLYSSSVHLVLSTGAASGVQMYSLDPTIGEFILTRSRLELPKEGQSKRVFSANTGNVERWDAPARDFVRWAGRALPPNAWSHRYIGAMVADLHRTLLYGGIFMYPADTGHPTGKLRLLYEAGPMAYILHNAGGAASTGRARIIDLMPESLHQRTPVFMGSKEFIAQIEDLYAAKAEDEPEFLPGATKDVAVNTNE